MPMNQMGMNSTRKTKPAVKTKTPYVSANQAAGRTPKAAPKSAVVTPGKRSKKGM